ncbi:VWA domain-containing protein [Flavobacterium sp. MXW15]|uniref:VWA domain-containing protein n=1 Tax=Xanthomonas chitinilytica TaxID=2989819 RepID=A0ABT3K0K2_9XANT|nr:VWA domain-containing protein [Xanthomonas sp. H13-6]MCW4456546.1 VWA domain-containing protein [Flavobacterium sp. MXW15]MCW4474249.1 VWA domain-containing protein [Xanthomonas sp. H13-6]
MTLVERGVERRRALRPLACALMLLGVPALAGEPVRPAPTQALTAPGQTQWPARQRQTAPNFQAPSATVCSDAPVFREVPDPQPRPQQVARDAPGAVRHVRERAMRAPPAPSAPPPPPSPSAAVERTAPAEIEVTAGAVAAAPVYEDLRAPSPQPPVPGPVTAGVVDDNADFGGFLQFLQRHPQTRGLGRDISLRQRLQVRDAQGRGVPDAEVVLSAANGARLWARTDAAGQVWLYPNAFDDQDSARYRVDVRRDGRQVQASLRRGQKNALEVVLPAAAPGPRARLDLVFMVDATGSMGDEIDKLRGSLQGIVRQIGQLPSNPDICLGLVSYRDRGDEYFVRSWDLTGDVGAFQGVLDQVRANGGGDNPEAMNEAFDHAVQALGWRGTATTRLLVALADAPPHLDYDGPRYEDTMLAALGKGIKVFSVAASGQDRTGETVQRQIAQYTGGRFIFLTYKDASNPASGAGGETVHDVANYSVDTLDALVVRLVREELAKLPKG